MAVDPIAFSDSDPVDSGPLPGLPPAPEALFPIFLKLEQFRVLLVGGGSAGLTTLTAILRNSPAIAVTVVAPRMVPELQTLADQHPGVQLQVRPYDDDDLAGADIVFVATDNPVLNQYIRTAAAARRLLTNVADAPEQGDFHLSSAGQYLPITGQHLQEDLGQKPEFANATTAEPADGPRSESLATAYWRRIAMGALGALTVFVLVTVLVYYFGLGQVVALFKSSGTFCTFVAVGFLAQLIDGLMGMGYGVVSAISLMSLGMSPVSVSASIHTAEVFASGASGYHHYRYGNVNKHLFRVLLLPGIAGSVAGALLLAHYGEHYANWIKPLLAVYLLILGWRILSKALRRQREKRRRVKYAGWLAGAGGFLDSFGGGGWGPLVTSTLIANGRTPQYVIGTVSLVEFFVAFASAFTFFTLIGISHWQIVAGLIVGGVAAAPIAAKLAGRIPVRWMFLGVGMMVILWSLWALRKMV
ncbi:TSUP family transporter [Hymenobacter lapidiphilus]|uniref:Probable membrane transporter protein n=1 Tax=Hymenobacter lapidiphilus TaxID=2608003 RepID=A0A7Y7U6Y7_9BACT|nr:TSUP family transporter [Hymenobacter lapidiphilus]NVO32294.1 TSUP family transporter [Hymenobacter lapidiphilus]